MHNFFLKIVWVGTVKWKESRFPEPRVAGLRHPDDFYWLWDDSVERLDEQQELEFDDDMVVVNHRVSLSMTIGDIDLCEETMDTQEHFAD